MPNILTVKEFAEVLKISPAHARQQCNSWIFRDNKIARKEGNEWRIDYDRYRKIVWGDK